MTSENDMDVNKEISTTEEVRKMNFVFVSIHFSNKEKTTIEEPLTTTDTKTEETTVASSEESSASKEEERTDIGKVEHDDVPSKADNEIDAPPLFEQPIVLEGKRSRKPTLRLEVSDLIRAKKELAIPQVNILRICDE